MLLVTILQQTDWTNSLDKIADNTKPLEINDINLLWWSFGIAVFSLVVGSIAAWYSFRGYKYQKISAKHLETLVPGHMSYYEIIGSLISNIFHIESIYFGNNSYKKYPVKMVLSSSKLPFELIHLEKYEKNKKCYDEAFKLNLSWQNYNTCIDLLIDYSENNKEKKKVLSLAQYIIDLTKAEIIVVQKFEAFLFEQNYIIEKTATNNRVACYIMNRFLETIHTIHNQTITEMDTSRNNLNQETRQSYIFSPYLPTVFSIESYLEMEHNNRLIDLGNEYSAFYYYKPDEIIKDIKKGEFDNLGQYIKMPSGLSFADINYLDFKSTYYNYIEPIIIGYKRFELSNFFSK